MNELYLLLMAVVLLAVPSLFQLLSQKSYASIGIFIPMVVIGLTGSKLIEVAGWRTNAGNILYAATMYYQYINYNHKGQAYTVGELNIVTSALLLFFVLFNLVALLVPWDTVGFSASLGEIASGFSRLFPASLSAFYVSQALLIMLFSRLDRQPVSIQYGVSTLIAQLVDSGIFFLVGFFLMGTRFVLELAVVGFALKALFILVSLPVLWFVWPRTKERSE